MNRGSKLLFLLLPISALLFSCQDQGKIALFGEIQDALTDREYTDFVYEITVDKNVYNLNSAKKVSFSKK